MPGFQDLFGAPPTIIGWAPGRVNLIGEHTDYQGGLVFPMPLGRGTSVALRPTTGDAVRIHSASEAGQGTLSFALGFEQRGNGWADYVQGVTVALRQDGHAISGFDALVTSDLLIGAGLASSAALQVAMLRALRSAFALPIDDRALAILAWRAETEFVGVPVGMMDQLVCSVGTPGTALFLDTRSLQHQAVSLPPGVTVLVVYSGISHRNADSGYRQRRHEAEEASRLLGVRELGQLGPEDLPRVDRLPVPLRQRARHVVTENARVLAFRAALGRGSLDDLGPLMAASHQSLRDDYQVSVPEIDLLVNIAAATPGVLGARLTGGGFGGAVVILAAADAAAACGTAIAAAYASKTGRAATIIGRGGPSRPAD
ncbi:MAG TPA: galactokinase [Polyangia bacterium]|nr:galactokinase [Polyangia bacterium]